MSDGRFLYLSSSSVRRRDILTEFQIPFDIIPNLLQDESISSNMSFRDALRMVAYRKALVSKADYQGLILGVDTVVCLEQHVLGKPASISQAKDYLKMLSDHTHQVISAVAVIDTVLWDVFSFVDQSDVTFRAISADEIDY